MRNRNLLLTSVLTIAVVGLFATVLTTSLLPGTATAGHVLTGHLHGDGRPGRWGAACGALDDRTARLLSAYVSISLDLDESQASALEPVIEVVERWHGEGGLCHGEIATAPAALDELDRLLDQTRTALNELRPAFEVFYGSLTTEQQERLNGWISRHHGSST